MTATTKQAPNKQAKKPSSAEIDLADVLSRVDSYAHAIDAAFESAGGLPGEQSYDVLITTVSALTDGMYEMVRDYRDGGTP